LLLGAISTVVGFVLPLFVERALIFNTQICDKMLLFQHFHLAGGVQADAGKSRRGVSRDVQRLHGILHGCEIILFSPHTLQHGTTERLFTETACNRSTRDQTGEPMTLANYYLAPIYRFGCGSGFD
jgi:hypothetical protein